MSVVQEVELNDLGLKRLAAEQEAETVLLASEELAGESDGNEVIVATSGGLPSSVDNSTLQYFPGIRSQGGLGSCAAFSVTYYTMTYMTALARGWDASDPGDNTTKFSPKWTYNMVNGGVDTGAGIGSVFEVLADHGAATWAELPYDNNYREWVYDDPEVWRNAVGVRPSEIGYLYAADDDGIDDVKTMLANGSILNFGTYIFSWQYKTIADDPSTTADDGEVGKQAAYWVNGFEGGHAMTVVGYNDNVWVDINGNGQVEAAEKGAFRIANSWGTGWQDGGFTWLSYDALKQVSEAGGPSANRQPAWQSSKAYWLTARESYTPTLLAEFTVQHAERNQLRMSLGVADSGTTPSKTWVPAALTGDGGVYGFDGISYGNPASAPAGTFVLDFTDLAPEYGASTVYFLGLNDTTDASLAGTLSSFTVTDWLGNPLDSATNVPQTDADGISSAAYAYMESTLTDFVVDSTWISVAEGSSSTLQVKLAAAPSTDVTVTTSWLSSDSDLSISSGSTLVFTTGNWDAYQTVEIAAAQDVDDTNGTGILQLSASGLRGVPIHVAEEDDEPIYQAIMDSDPGWTYEGEWEWGAPQGGGGSRGNADPASAATGKFVVGYNLAGDYAANTSPAAWLTTTAIDCSGYADVELRFSRWLNVEQPAYDQAYLEVSNNGVTWTQIWTNSEQITDAAWTLVSYDISAIADDAETVYIRWGIESDGYWQFSGWNIDDVALTGTATGGGSENVAPVADNATFSVSESAANTTVVGTVTATDADSPAQTLTYAITAGNGDGVFAINGSTGQITVADNSSLDYETTAQYSLTVRVTDNGSPNLSDTATITVNVTGVNEAPVLGSATFSVSEDAASGANVGTVSGTDEDSPAQTLTYAITAGNGDGVFAINGSTGQITVADNSSLDYETTAQYSLTVRVTDNGSPNLSDTATITVNVTGVNEAPVLGSATFSVSEDAASGANVGTVSGTDEDSPAQTLTYAITAGNGDGVFAINGSTGQITVADNSSLDYETTAQYSLTVRVTDNGSPNLSDTATITVNVTGVNEAPVLGGATFSLSEDAASGANVGTVSGTDEDSPAQTLTYAITAGNGDGVFAINGSTGQITVADNSSLDYETTAQYSLTVRVTDNGSPNLSDTATITVNVTDVNDPPVLGDYTFSVSEDAADDTVVGVVEGSDEDEPPATLVYTIIAGDDDGVFKINPFSGEITVDDNSTLDYETTNQYTLTVQAEDNGYPSQSTTATVTINVNDVNEAPLLGNATFSLSEDAASGVNVGTVSGTDEDSPAQTLTYAITAGNGDGVFAIDSSTGQITVADNSSLDYETTGQYSLTVQVTDDGSPNLSDTATVTIEITLDEAKTPIGDLGNGIATMDNATGTGFLMYSEEDLATRFSDHPPLAGNATHVIAVKYLNGQWYFDNNGGLYAFTPVASDVLLAEVDFSADTVTSLEEVAGSYHGIVKGYGSGDIVFTANEWKGNYNAGEFGISGTHFVQTSRVFVEDLGGGVAATDNATGSGFLMYSEETLVTRFSKQPPLAGNAAHVIAVKCVDGDWYYDNNGALYAFAPVASDVLLAEIDFSADTATSLEGVDEAYGGIAKGYVGGDLSFAANRWNGVHNTGEFGISGSWFIANDQQFVGDLGGGVAATDNATGSGFLMYSEENLATRFSDHPPLAGNAAHVIAVKCVDGDWYYDNNGALYAFAPVASDVLLAEIDFSADTATSLEGVDETYSGIVKGYVGGDLSFTANRWNGVYNTGEFGVSGSWFIPNDVQHVGDLGGGIAAMDNATGAGFLLYSEEDLASRFSEHPPLAGNASHLITVKYFDDQWYYDSNGGLYAFTAEASDVLLAEIDFREDTIMSLAGVDDLYYGIAKGYMGGNLSFAANSWNGVYNTGEFGISGSFFRRNA